MTRTISSVALHITVPLSFLLLWSFAAVIINNAVILPTVSEVADLLVAPTEGLISMGSLLSNVLVSLIRVLMGYIVAVALAIPLGILMGTYGRVYSMLNNFLSLFRPIPPLAWVPLVTAWFGVSSLAGPLGLEQGQWYIYLSNLKFSMLFIIFIGAFYPILTSTIYGVKNVHQTLIEASRVLGADEWTIFRKVVLPAAMPSIVTGLRIGLGIAWMCLVSAEMLPGSLSGIGYLITHAYTLASTDIVIAGMVCIGVVGAFMDLIFRYFEEKKFTWQRMSR
jgi:NitT/TauT family transport system permease protein